MSWRRTHEGRAVRAQRRDQGQRRRPPASDTEVTQEAPAVTMADLMRADPDRCLQRSATEGGGR